MMLAMHLATLPPLDDDFDDGGRIETTIMLVVARHVLLSWLCISAIKSRECLIHVTLDRY